MALDLSDRTSVQYWYQGELVEASLYPLVVTVKYGGLSLMVWGAIWNTGCSDLVECIGDNNARKYISVSQKGLRSIFFSQGHHVFNVRQSSMSYCTSDTSLPGAKSGSSSTMISHPKEYVWTLLDRSLYKKRAKLTSHDELFQLQHSTWVEIFH